MLFNPLLEDYNEVSPSMPVQMLSLSRYLRMAEYICKGICMLKELFYSQQMDNNFISNNIAVNGNIGYLCSQTNI